MAGMPVRRGIAAKIKKAGGDDYLMDQIGAGRTVTALSAELGMSRAVLNAYLLHADRKDSYARAKQSAAAALVDESLEIVDAADQQTVQLAKLQSETRRWVAGKLDREAWGEQQGPQIAIQINTLHSGMLRQRDTDD